MRTFRTRSMAVLSLLAFVVVSGCAPAPPPAEPPPLAAIVTPSSVRAGATVYVVPPDEECVGEDSEYQYLEAVVTIPSSGVVVARAWQSVVPAFSEFAGTDPIVTLNVPRTLAPSKYLVYLSCFSYLDSFQYAPARLTVLP